MEVSFTFLMADFYWKSKDNFPYQKYPPEGKAGIFSIVGCHRLIKEISI